MSSSISPYDKDVSPRWVWLLLISAGLLRFLNLGFHDLQAWDEALYTVRAESILLWGHWLDQSTHAIGGLYSALHPPLQVWLSALLFKLTSVNEFTARLVSAVAGALTLPVIFLIGRQLHSRRLGLLAALLYGLTPFTVFFTRQGQFDSLLTFFLTLSAFFIIKSLEGGPRQHIILAGIAAGLGLMTKLFVALGMPLAYAGWIIFMKPNDGANHWKRLGLLVGIMALVALPWHVFMTVEHGGGNPFFFLQQSSILERSFTGVEGNTKSLEIFYYINQLFVLFPVGASWLIFGVWQSVKTKENSRLFLSLWFLLFFVIFSLMRTKLAFYLLPILVPGSLLAARTMLSAMQATISLRTVAVLFSGTWISVLWAASQSWRTSVKNFLLSVLHFQFPDTAVLHDLFRLGLLVSLGLIVILLLFHQERLKNVVPHVGLLLILPLAMVTVFQVNILDRTQYKDGAVELAHFVNRRGIHSIVVAGYDRNPQLTYYLRGADIGWRTDLHVRRIIPPEDSTQYHHWLRAEMSTESSSTLLLIEKDKFVRYETVQPLNFVPGDFHRVFESRRYSGFLRPSGPLYARSHEVPFTLSPNLVILQQGIL